MMGFAKFCDLAAVHMFGQMLKLKLVNNSLGTSLASSACTIHMYYICGTGSTIANSYHWDIGHILLDGPFLLLVKQVTHLVIYIRQ